MTQEDEIRAKYSYYTSKMLAQLLDKQVDISDLEVKIIREMLKEQGGNSGGYAIIDGGIKDVAIITLRWHVVFLFFAYLETLLHRRHPYGWSWVDGLVNYIFILGGGLIPSALLVLFFTSKFKGKFLKYSFVFSVLMTVVLYVGSWLQYCRGAGC